MHVEADAILLLADTTPCPKKKEDTKLVAVTLSFLN